MRNALCDCINFKLLTGFSQAEGNIAGNIP